MTACEKLGYKVGDKFEVVLGESKGFPAGEIITLAWDDGTENPKFTGNHYDGDGYGFIQLHRIKPIAAPKLRQAKQFIADAIHASGKGWPDGVNWAAQDKIGMDAEGPEIAFHINKPVRRERHDYMWNSKEPRSSVVDSRPCDKLHTNWHQTVLSREEYFSAYPAAKSTAVGDDETNIAAKEELEALEQGESPEQLSKLAEAFAPSLDLLMTEWQLAKSATESASDALKAATQAESDARERIEKVLRKYGWL